MKANLFAVVLSLFTVSFSTHAATPHAEIKTLTTEQKTAVKIDLNKADAESLAKSMKGIGQKRSEAIIKYREEHGPFKSFEELAEVKGLGKQFVKNHLTQLRETFLIN